MKTTKVMSLVLTGLACICMVSLILFMTGMMDTDSLRFFVLLPAGLGLACLGFFFEALGEQYYSPEMRRQRRLRMRSALYGVTLSLGVMGFICYAIYSGQI